ncbi:TfuA-like protein [Mesorhizobium sp. CA5]|uniref:TfuA-like protein n=1 Tax=Mesorhizobium sp. CA5 TaxID=2876638 RepID=UPI001CD04638|nr:TfuA-like protein [Mesorhizobium sp. CA5]MBZ9843351.1 TfuA-like core domain-containing protein [Mesorhizobium sp. CA5]
MKAVVFAGPSICGMEKGDLAEVDLRPPAACGDILRACRDGVSRIGIVDGVFESCPSVWHKEILFALALGVEVSGAASMGALRAAECHRFGMQGVGVIFEQYLSGQRIADADVAVLHAPPELAYRPLTVALVDVEATIAQLSGLKLLVASQAPALLAAARVLHFKERTWSRILDVAGFDQRATEMLARNLQSHTVSQKTLDAKELIKRLGMAGTAPHAITAAQLNRTIYLDTLQATIAAPAPVGGLGK